MTPDLQDVALAYRDAKAAGRWPTKAVAERWKCSPSTATRWVARAKDAGLISTVHSPRRCGWTNNQELWMACERCRTPWPCAYSVDNDD